MKGGTGGAVRGYLIRRMVDAATFGPARRRRSMDAALRRLDFDDQDSARGPTRRARGLALGALVAVTLLAALFWGLRSIQAPASQVAYHSAGVPLLDTPTTTHIYSTKRLLPAPTAVPSSSEYSLMNTDGGRPVTWEPCRPIHYVVHKGDEPAAFDAMFQSAVAEISRATGLKFIDDGTTGELLLSDPRARPVYQPRTYGDRWAPVLVAWASGAESGDLAGTEAGFGGAADWAPGGGGASRYVSGVVAFNVPGLRTLSAEPHGATLVRDVLLHELGHLIGLGHVQDKLQLMYPTLTKPYTGYGPGDLAGLARLGNGKCYTDY